MHNKEASCRHKLDSGDQAKDENEYTILSIRTVSFILSMECSDWVHHVEGRRNERQTYLESGP